MLKRRYTTIEASADPVVKLCHILHVLVQGFIGTSPIALIIFALLVGQAVGQVDFEAEPINYQSATPNNYVQALANDIEAGGTELGYDEEEGGYLRQLLELLDVPISSQVLVYSKTSFQPRKISPRRPRAVYFNDDVHVGWVQRGEVIEISVSDPKLGAVFYTLRQEQLEHPRIDRDQGHCIVCHASSKTSHVPGHLVRSVFTKKSGHPDFSLGTFTTDYRSPFRERWGGWYVTGTHGAQRHMGNVFVSDAGDNKLDTADGANADGANADGANADGANADGANADGANADGANADGANADGANADGANADGANADGANADGANVVDLSARLNTQSYLSPHSDIVALMVLEHQTRMHNLIAQANMDTRSALHYDAIMNQALERPSAYRSDSSKRRIARTAEQLVECMLFVDEYQLTDVVKGTSGFAEEFARRGPFDHKNRSLRQFDLTTRMMKYPCSYLIYSASFDGLPTESKEVVLRRVFDILSGKDDDPRYAHLTQTDRSTILEILRETKDGLPEYWQQSQHAPLTNPRS